MIKSLNSWSSAFYSTKPTASASTGKRSKPAGQSFDKKKGDKSFADKKPNAPKVDYRRRNSKSENRPVTASIIEDLEGEIDVGDETSEKLPIVTLFEGKSRLFKDGNPLVYGGAVRSVTSNTVDGDLAIVRDHQRNIIGKGFYNSVSMYRVRMAARASESEYNLEISELIETRIKQAISRRKMLCLPSTETNAYRLVNGEGDMLSGLMIDVFGDLVTIQSSALWVEKHKETIKAALTRVLGIRDSNIVWKCSEKRLKQDGMTDAVEEDTSSASTIVIQENGIKYQVQPQLDQKTGFYCDQRQNRVMMRGLSNGRTVLDAYCYSGGFAMNAVLGGASHVTAVDSAEKILKTLKVNLQLNGMEGKVDVVEGDCVTVMTDFAKNNRHFDIVICDPPKIAPTRATLYRAAMKYQQINAAAMQVVNPAGGLLLTCTCSSAMTQSGEFLTNLQLAAKVARRTITVLSVSGPAADHTTLPNYPEGNYLTAVLLHVN